MESIEHDFMFQMEHDVECLIGVEIYWILGAFK